MYTGVSSLICRSCGSPIRYIRTPQGKLLEVNPEEGFYPEKLEDLYIVTVDGQVFRTVSSRGFLLAIYGYVLHYQTCPSRKCLDKHTIYTSP